MKKILIYTFLLLTPLISFSDNDLPQEKYSALEGRHFLIGFMQNEIGDVFDGDGFAQKIYITSSSLARVNIYFPDGQTIDIAVQPYDMVDVNVPARYMTGISEYTLENSVEIKSDKPITVYGFSSRLTTSDAYSAIPVRNWGTEYYVMSYPNDQYYPREDDTSLDSLYLLTPRHSQFMIIAAENNTEVMINPKARTYAGKQKDRDHWFTLDKGDCYLVQSESSERGTSDLTGSYIKSTKPIGVLSGHQRTAIPQTFRYPFDSKDHLIEMLPPLDSWGSEYISIPFGVNDQGDLFKLVAAETNTNVLVDYGEGFQEVFMNDKGSVASYHNLNKPAYWSSDKPFQIAQFMQHSAGIYDNTNYDPSMVMLMPVNEFVTYVNFQTPGLKYVNKDQYNHHYVCVVAQQEAIPTLTLDGQPVTEVSNIVHQQVAFSGYYYAIIEVSEGKHSLRSKDGLFSGVIFGTGSFDSYATVLGAGMNNVFENDTIAPEFSLSAYCGEISGKIYETDDPVNSGIRTIEVVESETNNYDWYYDPITDNTMAVNFSAEVENEYEDATMSLIVRDHAGNGKKYIYTFGGIDLDYPENIYINTMTSKDSTCVTFHAVNEGNFSVDIEDIRIYGDDRVTLLDDFDYPVIIPKKDSLEITLCAQTTQDSSLINAFMKFFFSCDRQANANIKGLVFNPKLRVSGHDFGEVLIGEEVCAQIGVLNEGEVPITLTELNYQSFGGVFTIDTIGVFPVTLNPESILNLEACFTPDETIDFSSNCSYENTEEVENIFQLKGKGVAPEVQSIVIDWGKRRIGTDNDTTFYIVNTGNAGDQIKFSAINGNTEVFGTSALENINTAIPGEDSISVMVSFSPSETKQYSATVELELDWELHNTVTVELKGIGSLPEISTNDVIFDPIQVFSRKDTNAAIIISGGNEPLSVTLKSTRGDENDFVINNGDMTILENIYMQPDSSLFVPIQYYPKTISDHEMVLTFEHDALIGNNKATTEVRLKGTAFSGDTASLVSSLSIDDKIIACQTANANFSIENSGDIDLEIQSLDLSTENVNAKWSSPLDLPIMIRTSNSKDFSIDVLAKRNQSGTINISGIANDTLNIYNSIEVAPENYDLTIQPMDQMDVIPGDTITFDIAGIFPSRSDIDVDFELNLEYPFQSLYLLDHDGLYLKDNQQSKSIPIQLNNENGKIKINSAELFIISEDSTKWSLHLTFLVLLGEDQTPTISLAAFSDDCYASGISDIKMQITDVCTYNLRLVEKYEPFTASISPNPVSNELNLDLFLNEKSKIVVKIFDKNGKKSHICKTFDLKKGRHSLIFGISSLTNGVYLLTVNAHNAQKNIMFIITK